MSVLEVFADRLDRQSLLLALEEGGPAGGRAWKLAVSVLGRAREPVLARHLWEHIWLHTPGTMHLGLWALGRCGDPCGGWAMRARVADPQTNDDADRYLAAMALGQLNDSDRLAETRTSPNVELRRASAFGFGFCECGNVDALRHLVGMLDDPDPAVRFVACQSLVRLGSDAAISKVLELAAKSESPADLCCSAMTALVALGRPQAAQVVVRQCGNSAATVRAAAAELLGELGGPAAERCLTALLGDPAADVRCAAVGSLARLGTESAIQQAAKLLDDADANVRIAAVIGLGRSLSPLAGEPLARVARDPATNGRLRHYAVLGLAQLADLAGAEAMAELASPRSANYLPFAARHLRLKTARQTAEFLTPMVTHADRDGACNAAGRLAELGYGPGVVELLEGSDVLDNHTRMEHLWATVRAAGREVTLALAEAAGGRRSAIRRAAAFALGGRLTPEAVDALIKLAHDEQPAVRLAAARSLGVTPDPLAADVLIDLAEHDSDLPAALEAARALRRRDFADLPRVRELFERLAGTSRDAGGIDAEPKVVAEQPAHSFVLRNWEQHPEENLVSNLTYEASLCYDGHNRRVVLWGAHGRRYDTPQTGLTWFLDVAANRWTRLSDSRHWPNGVCGVRGTMYDDANRVVLSPRSGGRCAHGWHNALRANLMHSSPWVLDVTTDQWYPARAEAFWAGGYMPGSHDPRHGVTLWWAGRLMAFDAYANRWIEFEPQGPAPQYPRDTGGVFDPRTGRFVAVGAGSTWAFDPAANAWTDLKPGGDHPPACPMVYDSANDVMLAFKVVDDHVGVWVYHLRENRWESLPVVHPCPARGQIWDVTYDRANNVAVIGGTNPRGLTASLNCRETWTYRYRPAAVAPALASPQITGCRVGADGSVTLAWSPAGDPVPASHLIERGSGEQPWRVEWKQVGTAPGDATAFVDSACPKELAFYRLVAVDAAGRAAAPGLPARTVPPVVRDVTAVVQADGHVRLRWSPQPGSDSVGYHIYRAPADLGSPWSKQFAPEDVTGTLGRITHQPIAATEFVDTGVAVAGRGDELTWPKTFAYVVRPVNAWGLEGGPSPVTLALPDPPGPVRVVPWADGRRLILWSTCNSGQVDRYVLMRMDGWKGDYVFRLHPGPLAVPACWDSQAFPTTDRRRYYASGIDALGTIGTPTCGAWSHGEP